MSTKVFNPTAGANSPVDGNVERSSSSVAFSTLRNGAGTNSSAVITSVGPTLHSTATTNQFDQLIRGIVCFDTSSIPSSAIITSATISFYSGNKLNGFGGTAPSLHIAGATPASTSDLADSDYGNVQRTSFGSKSYSSWSTAGVYNDIALNASGLANIDKAGISKFSTQLSWDLTGSFSGTWVGQRLAFFNMASAETDNPPKLTVNYTLPTLYWVGGTGNWSDEANWSVTSGGAGGDGVPDSTTDVFFDANSFSAGGQTVTLNVSNGNCKNMDWTGATNSPTISTGTNNMNIYGSIKFISAMTRSGTFWYLFATSGSHTITSAGRSFTRLFIGIDGGTATWTLQDNLTATGSMRLYAGTFTANGNNVTVQLFERTSVAPAILNMGSGTWTLTGNAPVWDTFNAANLTVNPSTSEIIITSTAAGEKTITTGTITLNDLTITGRNITWTGNTTVNNLALNNAGLADGLKMGTGTKTVTGNMTNNGSVGSLTILQSNSAGTARTITKSSGIVAWDYADIKDSTVTGGAAFWAGANSTDSGNNTGWTFTAPTYISSISGTLLLSGTVLRPSWQPNSSITGTLLLSGTAYGVKLSIPTQVERKTYSYKVYDESDNFLGEWTDVITELGFSEEINSAGSAVEVELARNSDSLSVDLEPLLDESGDEILDNNNLEILTTVFSRNQVGPGSNVNHNYRVDIFVYYGESSPLLDSNSQPILDSDGNEILTTIGAPNGVRRFNGFISDISTQYGDTETTLVTLISYGFDLDQYVVETDGGDTTVPFNSYDPSDIVREGLDQFGGLGGLISYTSATISNTSTVVSYTFRVNTFLELLRKSLELAPADWFFYVDLGTNNVVFRPRPSTPQHTFRLGVEIKSLRLRSYIEDVVNDVYFIGGEVAGESLYIRITDTPAAGTRRGLKRITDNRVTLTASANILSQGEIDRNNQRQYRSTITILDKLYDIESIKLGDLIGFRNFDNYVDALTMQVVSIDYSPDMVVLQLDTLLPSVNKRIEDIRRNLEAQENELVPNAPS